MAQTTGGVSAVNAVIEWSTNGSSWTAFSGHANKVSVSGGDRATGAIETFDGDTMILTAGKRKTLKIKADFVYTESGAEIQEAARTAQQAGTAFYLRWTVKAASTGNFRYTTASGYLTAQLMPDVDAGDPKPVMGTLELETPEITKATVP